MFTDFHPERPMGNTADSAPVSEQLHPSLFGEVRSEIARARAKHGWESTPAAGDLTDAECLIILVEEVGEVARAMTYDEGDPDNLDKELIQVAAMALAWRNGRRLQRIQADKDFDPPICGDRCQDPDHDHGYDMLEAPAVKVFDKLTSDTGEMQAVRLCSRFEEVGHGVGCQCDHAAARLPG